MAKQGSFIYMVHFIHRATQCALHDDLTVQTGSIKTYNYCNKKKPKINNTLYNLEVWKTLKHTIKKREQNKNNVKTLNILTPVFLQT